MYDRPVFIGGFRSGTTLLINLLGMHADVAPWFETKDLCEALRWLRVLRDPDQAVFEAGYVVPRHLTGFDVEAVHARMLEEMEATFDRIEGAAVSGKAGHERYPLGHDCLGYTREEGRGALARWREEANAGGNPVAAAAATRRLIEALGEAHRRGLERARWINKTPEISRFAPELRAVLGGCRVIYLVRNGLDVVSSAAALGWGEVEQLAYNWKGLLERTRAVMAPYPGDYLELRYEDLLAAPATVLDRALDFCGLSCRGEDIVAEFSRRFGAAAFDRSRIGGGSRLSLEQRAAFERIAGDLQAALGYA